MYDLCDGLTIWSKMDGKCYICIEKHLELKKWCFSNQPNQCLDALLDVSSIGQSAWAVVRLQQRRRLNGGRAAASDLLDVDDGGTLDDVCNDFSNDVDDDDNNNDDAATCQIFKKRFRIKTEEPARDIFSLSLCF